MNVDEFDELDLKTEIEMTTETNATPVEEVNVSEEVSETVEDSDESTSTSEEASATEEQDGESNEAPWGKPDEVPKGVRDRFRKLTQRNKTYESKINELESAMKAMLDEKNKNVKAPTKDDFQNEEEYINYLVAQRMHEQMAQAQSQAVQQEQLKKQADEINTKWDSAMETASKDLPDYDDVVSGADTQLPIPTMRHLAQSDIGPYVIYTIARDQNVQNEINQMSPVARHQKVLEIENRVGAWLQARNQAPAQAPVGNTQLNENNNKTIATPKKGSPSPLKGKNNVNLDPSTADVMDWIEAND